MQKHVSRDKLGRRGTVSTVNKMLWMQASFQMIAQQLSIRKDFRVAAVVWVPACSPPTCWHGQLLTWAVADMGCLLTWTFTYSGYLVLQVFGVSLNKPHTSVTVLHMCVCMVAWLWPHTINLKWAQINISQRSNVHVHVHFSSVESGSVWLLPNEV